jgi:7,8-dihydropterin-6-yl-methyl-4-(beta-D-ribofuranosyl)aminobenzene 5'-phosphate synthase
MDIDLNCIQALILSHGHEDHCGALLDILHKIKKPTKLIMHPWVFHSKRYLEQNNNSLFKLSSINLEDIELSGVNLVITDKPYVSEDHTWLTAGAIDRVTDFEIGLPNALIEIDGQVQNDPIWDDQAVVLHLKDKGLVVISGCAHAGIINTIHYARRITGVDDVYAVIGGFHLGGHELEKIIEPTIKEMKMINPDKILPLHCTGRKAIHMIQEVLGQASGSIAWVPALSSSHLNNRS